MSVVPHEFCIECAVPANSLLDELIELRNLHASDFPARVTDRLLAAKDQRIVALEAALLGAKRGHDQHVCVKGTPMHDELAPCRCGADEHNARIDAVLR